MSALYIMRYTGAVGGGEGVLYFGRGVILGVDIGNVRYQGTYTDGSDSLRVQLTMTAPKQGFLLVTGQMLKAGQSINLSANFAKDFDNGEPQQLLVGGQLVAATFEKIGDLP